MSAPRLEAGRSMVSDGTPAVRPGEAPRRTVRWPRDWRRASAWGRALKMVPNRSGS